MWPPVLLHYPLTRGTLGPRDKPDDDTGGDARAFTAAALTLGLNWL
jgi:hypothetical protein